MPPQNKPPTIEIDAGDLSSQMSIMNILRTGNILIDTIVSMSIPALFISINFLLRFLIPLINTILLFFTSNTDNIEKLLEYEFYEDSWGDIIDPGTGERNQILQKAVLLYIGELKGLKLTDSQVSLSFLKNKDVKVLHGDSVDQLAHFSITTLPIEDDYVEVEKDISFLYTTYDEQEELSRRGRGRGRSRAKKDDDGIGKANKKIITYYFKSKGEDGEEKIKAFVQKALDWYTERLKSIEDDSRYLYLLQKKDNKEKAEKQLYKRYKLSDEKQFNGLFFPEKHNLLHLLDQFLKKEGKYAISGYPHKLGLLLHGPPGTGKTSLIKALAQYTKRHVVSIPLSKITTNQELMDIIFDQSFAVKGADMPYRHSFAQVIYVMEDIDAATQIVLAREHQKPEKQVDDTPLMGPLLEDGSSGTDDLGSDAAVLMAMLNSLTDIPGVGIATETADGGLAMDSSGWITVGGGGKDFKKSSGNDKLDLAGLLNVLDGVVDCPGRLLVLTTNHPEKIDPALIRPGRVDKMIYLGYIQTKQAQEMIEHYFQLVLTPKQIEYITLAFEGKEKHPTIEYNNLGISCEGEPGELFLTPAELEQMCAEQETIEDFLITLVNHSILVESLRRKEKEYETKE